MQIPTERKPVPLIAANWKMHMTVAQAQGFLQGMQPVSGSKANVVLFVPATALWAVAQQAKEKNIAVGLQNIHWEAQGAFTGEISAQMLLDAGGSHVILGHSERRSLFGETDVQVNLKVRAAQGHGILPVVCVGESLEQRESGGYHKLLCSQLVSGLIGVDPGQLVVAYEPVWAIGTGQTATLEQMQETMDWIRRVLGEQFGQAGTRVPLLYGGSVKPDNIAALATLEPVNGFLIGGASLCAESMMEMLRKLP